jgi:transcriptional regulator with XRE-family HTH domain
MMTPARLSEVIEHCFRVRRKSDLSAFYRDIAAFLGVDPATLRRWLHGEAPIPSTVDILFEIFAHWPEVTAGEVREIIRRRDEAE